MERAKRDADRVFSVIRKSAPAPQSKPPARPTPAPTATPPAKAARTETVVPKATESAKATPESQTKPADAREASPAAVATVPAPTAASVVAKNTSAIKQANDTAASALAARAVADAAEEAYAVQVRTYLESIKRYPSSREAREKRPAGTVRVWLSVHRSGRLTEAGVEASSGSLILDQEALRSVRLGHYPAFPTEAFAGQDSRRFVIGMAYAISGGQ